MRLAWRRSKGGRHAGARATSGTALPVMPQPAPLLPLRAAEQERPADPVPVPTTGVRLVFAAGPAVALDPADPRTKTFLMVAGELLRAAPEARGHGQL